MFAIGPAFFQGVSGGGASTDPYFSSVVALLHMNGANAGTTFTDQKSHTFAASGNAQTSTMQSQWNGSSGLFDGAGDLVTSAYSADWDFGSGDFTIEFWVRPASTSLACLISRRANASAYAPFQIYSQSGKIGVYLSTTGTSWVIGNQSVGTPLATNAWSHIAVCRQGTNLYVWVNGVNDLASTPTTFSGALWNPTANGLSIGAYLDASSSLNGNLADLRLTKGVARYTSAFTPPSAAFPDS